MKLLIVLLMTFLLAVPTAGQTQTLAAAAASNPDFSTLITLVASADLIGLLDDTEAELTVFAPTNGAFDAVPEEVLSALMSDPALLTRVLTYHVTQGRLDKEALTQLASAPSMEMDSVGGELYGSELLITSTGEGISINAAPIVLYDVEASNGIIHVIESVLFPPDIAEMFGLATPAQPAFIVGGTLNPAGLENDLFYVADPLLTTELATAMTLTTDIASVESAAFDSYGGIYITVDLSIGEDGVITAGGLLRYDSFFGADFFPEPVLIAGESSGIVAPKGLQVLETLGVVAIADQGAKNVKLFALDAGPDDAPTAVLSIGEGGSVWDVWYDILNDTLYAAKTNGDLAAYDFFSESRGADGPDRMITPTDADGNKISVNLHGIEIDYDSNTVILTDVGDATVNNDGQIFLMRAISISDGPTPVDARIFGDQTQLGNPVDVIFDGNGIYVAEKANDLLLYYANILDREGELNVPAEIVTAATKVESAAIYPTRESKLIADMGLME